MLGMIKEIEKGERGTRTIVKSCACQNYLPQHWTKDRILFFACRKKYYSASVD